MPANKCRKNNRNRKSPLFTATVIADSSNSHQLMLKLLFTRLFANRIFTWSQVITS